MSRPAVRILTLSLSLLLLSPAMLAGATEAPAPDDPAQVPKPLMLDVSEHLQEFEDALIQDQHVPVPAYSTGIGPGSLLVISMGGSLYICTANFIWSDGTTYYLGAAGHCFIPPGTRSTHAPEKDYDRNLTSVAVCIDLCLTGGLSAGFFRGNVVGLGKVAYARQSQGGVDVGNDFGIVEIPAARHNLIRTTLPVWGGPTGEGVIRSGTLVCHYGRGTLVGETFLTMARLGVGVSQSNSTGQWTAVLASEPGDSGSAVVTCGPEGTSGWHGIGAVGILTHGIGVPLVGLGGGLAFGTTIGKARAMATQAGLTIDVVYTYP